MNSESSRDRILKKVRLALGKGDYAMSVPEFASPVMKELPEEDIALVFAENFVQNKGTFFYCENIDEFMLTIRSFISQHNYQQVFVWEKELIDALSGLFPFSSDKKNFISAEVGITTCEALIARTGSILISSQSESGRSLGIFPHVHVVVAFSSQISKEIADALALIKTKYQHNIPSMIGLVTGPSRTADIEKTLVLGAHGPKELVLFLIDDTSQK